MYGGALTIVSLPYGKGVIPLTISPSLPFDTITYRLSDETADQVVSVERIRSALAQPMETPPLHQLARGKRSAVIVVSDGTRLCPSELLLPELLKELHEGGIPDEAVDIIIALGMHRKHTEEELRRLVGTDIFDRVRVHNHSAAGEDCIRVGVTSAGTPIEINRLAVQADLRILTGNIEPHALVGISGGVKALVPGIASHSCIEHNHSLSLQYQASLGRPDNPIHRDLEEALRFISVDFILNVVVNHVRHVLSAAAGHVITAHRAGVETAMSHFVVPVDKTYDIVIVSPGGHPKDIQLYQAIKALRNASAVTKPGGAIFLVAECPEMFGNGIFQFWVETKKDRERMVAALKQQFVLGAHKVLHLDEVLSKHRVHLHSALPQSLVVLLGFLPSLDAQTTVDELCNQDDRAIAIMPHGALTFPSLQQIGDCQEQQSTAGSHIAEVHRTHGNEHNHV
jgi:nickel-dependent lactate racemase